MNKYCSICLAVLFLLAACAPAPASNPSDLVINEYPLSYGPDIGTDQLVFKFASGDQAKILAQTAAQRDYQAQAVAYNSQALAQFGYTLKPSHSTENGSTRWSSEIWRGETLVAKDIAFMRPISVNASKTNFIGFFDLPDGTYILTRDRFELQPFPPVKMPRLYVGDQLLSLETSDISGGQQQVGVYLDDKPVYQTSIIPAMAPYGPTDGPWSWDGHWALVLLDAKQDAQGNPQSFEHLIVDSKDVNAEKGYEQAFQFAVLDNRPFYFYQRDGKIGISFDGKELAKGYEEIPHYQCCSGSLLNPGISMNMVWFFARRGKDWYYVEAYVPAQ